MDQNDFRQRTRSSLLVCLRRQAVGPVHPQMEILGKQGSKRRSGNDQIPVHLHRSRHRSESSLPCHGLRGVRRRRVDAVLYEYIAAQLRHADRCQGHRFRHGGGKGRFLHAAPCRGKQRRSRRLLAAVDAGGSEQIGLYHPRRRTLVGPYRISVHESRGIERTGRDRRRRLDRQLVRRRIAADARHRDAGLGHEEHEPLPAAGRDDPHAARMHAVLAGRRPHGRP